MGLLYGDKPYGVSLVGLLNYSSKCYDKWFWVVEVVSLFGSNGKDVVHGNRQEEGPRILYWKSLFSASPLAGV